MKTGRFTPVTLYPRWLPKRFSRAKRKAMRKRPIWFTISKEVYAIMVPRPTKEELENL